MGHETRGKDDAGGGSCSTRNTTASSPAQPAPYTHDFPNPVTPPLARTPSPRQAHPGGFSFPNPHTTHHERRDDDLAAAVARRRGAAVGAAGAAGASAAVGGRRRPQPRRQCLQAPGHVQQRQCEVVGVQAGAQGRHRVAGVGQARGGRGVTALVVALRVGACVLESTRGLCTCVYVHVSMCDLEIPCMSTEECATNAFLAQSLPRSAVRRFPSLPHHTARHDTPRSSPPATHPNELVVPQRAHHRGRLRRAATAAAAREADHLQAHVPQPVRLRVRVVQHRQLQGGARQLGQGAIQIRQRG